SHSSSGTSSKATCRARPTLLTSTSSPPSAAEASATARSGSPGCARSADTCATSPTPGAPRRPHVTTCAPSTARSRAVSRPMPPVEPVTRHVRASSPRSTGVASVSRMATTIAMVRHGETDWNRENRFQGHADPPLNDRGRSQARTLAGEFDAEAFDAVYSSPLHRASETASILVAARAVEVKLSDALREVDVGSWSGLTRAEVERRHPAGYQRWLEYGHGWDDGETYDELGRRVVSWLLELAGTHDEA